MGDAISRAQILMFLNRMEESAADENLISKIALTTIEYFRNFIAAIPSIDAVSVVRCRECIHRYYHDEDGVAPVCTASMAYVNTPDDWFCKDGQRREDGDIVEAS